MSSRFAVATQILTVVASEPDRAHRSEDLATWAGTNPAVIRRILQMLGRAGLTCSQLGKGGGSQLSRDAHEISLADIYNAVEDGELLAMPRCGPDETCRIGAHIGDMVRDAAKRAETALEQELSLTSLGDLVAALNMQTTATEHT
ncbi:MAG: Rrf2 family transcriptional regulator [Pseudomonadota bacterium]